MMNPEISRPTTIKTQTFDAPELISALDNSDLLKNSDALGAVENFIKSKNIRDYIPSTFQIRRYLDGGLSSGTTALINLAQQHDPDGRIMGAVKARAWKELAIYTSEMGVAGAQDAITTAMDTYREQYRTNSGSRVRSGLNLIGLATLAHQFNVPVPEDIDRARLATSILEELNRVPASARETQYHASRAEALVALDDMDGAQVELGKIAQDPTTSASTISAITRQLRDLWRIGDTSEQGSGIVQALRAAALAKNYDLAVLHADEVRSLAERPAPSEDQLHAILGRDGPLSYQWMKVGMETAQSVGVIRLIGTAQRFGSGFLIRGGDVKPELGDELCVLTNAHVVSLCDADESQRPEDVEIVFEAADNQKVYRFSGLAQSWPRIHLDATLLRFADEAPKLKPLPLAPNLPLADGKQRVYIIGYPSGGELSFSMQNNMLIDHEGPPTGTPVDPTVRRVHYTAPAEPGSSGSPVFNANNWRVIALHHAGSKEMKRLNGRNERWPANEGIWIQSIRASGGVA